MKAPIVGGSISPSFFEVIAVVGAAMVLEVLAHNLRVQGEDIFPLHLVYRRLQQFQTSLLV